MRVTDAVGNELEPGDTVVYRKTRGLGRATIAELTVKQIYGSTVTRIKIQPEYTVMSGGRARKPYKQMAHSTSVIKVF